MARWLRRRSAWSRWVLSWARLCLRVGILSPRSVVAVATAAPTTTARPVPTDAQVKEAFESFVKERADHGVEFAQSVTSVTVTGGVATVALDPAPGVLETSPFDNLAKLFGTPVIQR